MYQAQFSSRPVAAASGRPVELLGLNMPMMGGNCSRKLEGSPGAAPQRYIPYAILPHISGQKPTRYGIPPLPPRKVGYRAGNWPLTDSHIAETQFIGDYALLVARINNSPPALWLFSTASTGLLIDASFAQSQAVAAGAEEHVTLTFTTEDGYSFGIPFARAQRADLRGLRARLNAIDPGSLEQPGSFGGVIGTELLRKALIDIDWPRSAVHLRDFPFKPSGITVPLRLSPAGQVLISVAMGNWPAGVWLLDTSSPESKVNPEFARKHCCRLPGSPLVEQLRLEDVITTVPLELRVISPEELRARPELRSVDGVLGLDVLRFFYVAFDTGRKQLTLGY